RVPHATAGAGLVDVDPFSITAESDPPAIRADTGPAHTLTGLDPARLQSIRVEEPTAGIRLHVVTIEHRLSDHLTVAARRNWAVAWLEGESFGWPDGKPSGLGSVIADRPAEETGEGIGE